MIVLSPQQIRFLKTLHLRARLVNFLSLVNLVQLLSKKSISAFIHAGSSSEYGLNSAEQYLLSQASYLPRGFHPEKV